jgi:hypothetical protein
MAIKDNQSRVRDAWIQPTEWRDGVPRDIAVMQRLDSLEHQNILKFRGYRLNMEDRRYRIYTDFCDYGTLHGVPAYYERRTAPWIKEYSML